MTSRLARLAFCVPALLASSIVCGLGCSSGGASSPSPAASDASAPLPPPPLAGSGPGHVVVRFPDAKWHRVLAEPGAAPEDLDATLGARSPGADDDVSLSIDGRFVALTTSRFGCTADDCVGVAALDAPEQSVVPSAVPSGRAAVAAGGNLVVYPRANGAARLDLVARTRSGTAWGADVLLTATSPYGFHHDVAIRSDGARIAFDCGPSPYQDPGTCLCEVAPDGTGFRTIVCPKDGPGGTDANETHHPAYAPDGSIVFEGDWEGSETIWRIQADGTGLARVTGDGITDDNSPCVLPDGRIVSLWLGRTQNDGTESGLHELKVMGPHGESPAMLVTGVDLVDVGTTCGF